MIFPSIEQLTRNTYNRYELVIATAKAARIITDVYNEKKEEMEKTASFKEISPSEKIMLLQKDPKEIPEEKPVKSAIHKIFNGEYIIIKDN